MEFHEILGICRLFIKEEVIKFCEIMVVVSGWGYYGYCNVPKMPFIKCRLVLLRISKLLLCRSSTYTHNTVTTVYSMLKELKLAE